MGMEEIAQGRHRMREEVLELPWRKYQHLGTDIGR
jgi:hypothetical protein